MNEAPLTADHLLAAYAQGYFPMGETRHGREIFWFSPTIRGILPLDSFHVPARLARYMRQCPYRITANACFTDVITACADTPRRREGDTWINETILALYGELHAQGHAHSIECWQQETLVGGLYGVSLGGAFFGESMFSRADHASKVALVALVTILRAAGYSLLDTQYVTDHLRQFGGEAIPQRRYLEALEKALSISPSPSSLFVSEAGAMLSASDAPVSLMVALAETSSRI